MPLSRFEPKDKATEGHGCILRGKEWKACYPTFCLTSAVRLKKNPNTVNLSRQGRDKMQLTKAVFLSWFSLWFCLQLCWKSVNQLHGYYDLLGTLMTLHAPCETSDVQCCASLSKLGAQALTFMESESKKSVLGTWIFPFSEISVRIVEIFYKTPCFLVFEKKPV